MTKAATHKTDLLEHFYAHLDENDWLDGVDLYQAGKVSQVEQYQELIVAKVSKSKNQGHEDVRLKVHPSGKVIQWIECTCKKNRAYGVYCEHIAAFVLHIEREKASFIKSLDLKTPLKPPALGRRTPKSASNLSQKKAPTRGDAASSGQGKRFQGASAALLSHLKGSIHQVYPLAHGPCLRVKIEVKPGLLSSYDLDLDAAAHFISEQACSEFFSEELRKLQVFSTHVSLGTRFFQAEPEKIIAERCVVLRFTTPQSLKAAFAQSPSTLPHTELRLILSEANRSQAFFHFIPFKSCSRWLGKEYFFIPEKGYWPLDKDLPQAAWHELPLSRSYRGDEAARLLQSGFQEHLAVGPIWLDEHLSSAKLVSLPAIAEIQILEEKDGWFRLDPRYAAGKSKISLATLLIQAQKNKRKFVKTENSWLKIPDFITQHQWQLDAEEQYIQVDTLGLMRLKAALGDFDKFVGSKQLLSRIKQKVEYQDQLTLPSLAHTRLSLRSYQEEGLKWFWWLYQNGLHGLLADDMGLGKTHQAMALMSAIQKQASAEQGGRRARFLIICPTTVLDHWEDKLREFAPNLLPFKYHGPKRISQVANLKKDSDTLITSYGILLRDIKELGAEPWDAVILDEAHYVKNNNTATYRAACKLQSRMRLCLTGTPMENHLGELKNLFDFLVPGYLGSDEYFRKNFMTPIQRKDIEAELALQKLIHPLKLRRTKKQVLSDLPSKIEDLRHCALEPEQVKLYRDIIQLQAKPLLAQLHEPTQAVPYLHIFALLQLLKQVCDHPALLVEGSDYRKHASGKFELLKELLSEALDSGNKIVIFSQYVKMIKIIEHYCGENNIGCVVMTGQTRQRGKVIEKFQTDPNIQVFAGSLLAGGIGIDLTAASVVIHYDRWWNASKENQATDRVHRIGQKKFVQVFKLVTRGTLEEKIDRMIAKKESVFNTFLDRDEELFKALSRQDLIELLQ